jgi:acyl dehydratase
MSTLRTTGQVTAGDALPSRTIHVERASLVQYAGASLDRNRIHWDERFATSVGLPDVIAHGMFTMGAALNVVTDWLGDAGRVLEYGTRFTKPVVVPWEGGADIEVSAVVKSVDPEAGRATIDLTALCNGDKVLGRAVAVVALG